MASDRRPIQLALVTTELSVGGAERCLTNVAIRLDRTRFAPTVYSLARRPTAERSLLVEQLQQGNIPAVFLDVRSNTQFFTAVVRLTRLLRKQAPGLVQTFLFHANVVGIVAARRASVPHRVMGIRVADPTRWRARIERRLAARVDAVTCVSESVAKHCRRLQFPADKLRVIPNGIDVASVSATPTDLSRLGVPIGRTVFTFVGRLDRQKGLDWLFDMLPDFLSTVPNGHVLIVGDGPEAAELRLRASQPPLDGRVTFAGWQTDVQPILAASRCLLLPSRWEGMPNVVSEAMAAGLPVICTRADGVEELVGSLAAEQCVAFGDSQSFLTLMCKMACDETLAARIGAANRQRVASAFSMERMIRAYEDLYESLVSSPRR